MGNKTKGRKKVHIKAKPAVILSKSKKEKKALPKVKKTIKAKPAIIEEEKDTPVEIELDDVEFFNEHAAFSGFLETMDSSKFKETTEEAESKPRRKRAFEQEEVKPKLPIRDLEGKLHAVEEEEEHEEEDEEEQENKENEEQDELEEVLSDVSDIEMEEMEEIEQTINETPQVEATPQEIRQSKKILLAKLCESILEDPEEGLKRSKESDASKLQQVYQLCLDEDYTIAKYAMVSLVSVFLDILPGYRIRMPIDTDSQQLKKNVMKLQTFETSLLANYQKFLKFLDTTSTDGLQESSAEGFAEKIQQYSRGETAVKCLAELLKKKHHFNFSMNIIMALIPQADSPWSKVSDCASQALEYVFENDIVGTCSLEIVKQMTRYIKKKSNRVSERFLRSLLALKLSVSMKDGQEARQKSKVDRKKRRRLMNEGDTIVSGLKEAEAVVDKSEKAKNQADLLHEVVLIYFRILKNTVQSPALPAILEGLSKWAFLIHLEVMIDLLALLKNLLKSEKLPLSSSLAAVLTGLRALKGPGRELMVDEKDFVDILYKLLLRLVQDRNSSSFPLALECIQEMFLKNKEIMVDRVAAFVKRLLLVSMYLPQHQVLAVLSLIRRLLHKYTKLQQILDCENEHIASGGYRADVDDPDFSNPYSSSSWDLSLLRFHWHPKVSSFSVGTAKLLPSLPSEKPTNLMETFNVEFNGKFVPKLTIPKPNPLHHKVAKKRKCFVRDSKLDTPFLTKLKSREQEINPVI